MKPFDLKKALAGAKVVTRSGEEVVRVIHIPECARENGRVIAVTKTGWTAHTEEGKYFIDQTPWAYDLFMAPEKKEGWLIIYHEGKDRTACRNIWYSEEEARNWAAGCTDVCSITRIEWEE